MADVADLAGVSKMSVSRVLKDPRTVSGQLRERIEQAIRELDYVPNRAAQRLSAASHHRVGLLYNYPRSAYAVDLLLGAMDQAAIADVQLLMRGCSLSIDDVRILRDLLSQKVDAVVLTPPLCESTELVRILDEAEVLAVLIGTNTRPAYGAALHIDEFTAAYEMTRHICELGHVRVGFIKGGRALSASALRFDGYCAALKDAGLDRDDAIVVPGLFTYRSGLEAAERLLTLPQPPTAIFASNDDMAAAAIATAHRLGLDVPRDVTICGFDDSWIATNIWPEVTTVRQPVGKMGTQAISIVSEMLATRQKDDGSTGLLFPHEIVIRASDGQPSTTCSASKMPEAQ